MIRCFTNLDSHVVSAWTDRSDRVEVDEMSVGHADHIDIVEDRHPDTFRFPEEKSDQRLFADHDRFLDVLLLVDDSLGKESA